MWEQDPNALLKDQQRAEGVRRHVKDQKMEGMKEAGVWLQDRGLERRKGRRGRGRRETHSEWV